MFWIVFAVVCVIAILCTEFERWGWATVSLLLTAGLWFWLSGTNFLTWIADSWLPLLVWSVAYLVAGTVWSFVKWYFFLLNFRDGYREKKEQWLESRNLPKDTVLEGEQLTAFQNYLKDMVRYRSSGYRGNVWHERPRAKSNKARIVAWMSFWPFSLVGTLLNDPIRRMFNALFTWLHSLYQQMSNHVLRNDKELL